MDMPGICWEGTFAQRYDLKNLKINCTSAVIILERNYRDKCDDLDKGRTIMDVQIKLISNLPSSYNLALSKPGCSG